MTTPVEHDHGSDIIEFVIPPIVMQVASLVLAATAIGFLAHSFYQSRKADAEYKEQQAAFTQAVEDSRKHEVMVVLAPSVGNPDETEPVL